MQKITPFLWFDDQAEEAAEFCTSLFSDSRVIDVARFGDEVPGPKGKTLVVTFELAGQRFMALNGGPGVFDFTGAISFFINCETQAEIDTLWEKLSAEGGQPQQCGWIKDRYGVYWQVVPTVLGELMGDPDPEKAGRVTQAMLQMGKLDIEGLKKAYAG